MALTRALISVSDKTGIVAFAKALAALGVEIVSTGGTKKALSDAGIPVKDISAHTGFPEMLNGRVKTLHPRVHGGLLALRDNREHQKEVEANEIQYIDLAVVNLYPFEQTVNRPNVTLEEAIENIDIGGPAMIRSAAKNYAFVTVVVDADDYDAVLAEITAQGDTTKETRFELMKKAYAHTARYDSFIANYFSGIGKTFPDVLNLNYKKVYDLRYGENPHQKGAWYAEYAPVKEATLMSAEKLQGKELSYNNITDAQACLDILRDFNGEPFCAILKHANPCGASMGANAEDAFRKAFAVDPESAFGGIIGVTVEVDEACAKAIVEHFAEIVIAPSYTDAAKVVLAAKKNLRVLKLTASLSDKARDWEMRKISGGIVVQEKDLALYNETDFKVVTKRAPTENEMKALLFAWKLCKHVKSNAIVYATDTTLVGLGAGQVSRVDSARIAAEKAKTPLDTCAMASEAFFPFRDSVDEAAKRGIKAIIEPGGSVNDKEVIDACNEQGIAMIFTGMRHFKH